ncbi:MAG: NnrS family protein [Gammaproteobacteria bacterium]|nr:NnrS family protein [Gammaproteobacteria bacterium]
MIELEIQQPTAPRNGVSVLNLGFRPFFIGAMVFAVVTVAVWTLVYTLAVPVPFDGVSPFQWHAHEMIYGYSLAVIAGFLLTAVRNWTGRDTVNGVPLLALFCLWAAARVSMLFGTALIPAAALFDVLFIAALVTAVAVPVLRSRMWRQLAILSKLVLLGAGSVVFYLGGLGYVGHGVHWGIYGGLYLVIGLILTMGRRVIPSFIERGVGYPVTLFNTRWMDLSSLVLFLALFVVEVFITDKALVPWLAGALFGVNAVRLAGWHTPGIWKKPLLWSLYLAYGFIVAGFLLLALSGFAGVSRFVALHAFAYGGIGLITLSMMVRVSLGHTGRDIHAPPRAASLAMIMLAAGTLFRVLLPVLVPGHYLAWVAVSQVLWIAAFALLVKVLLPMLLAPRVDGRFG